MGSAARTLRLLGRGCARLLVGAALMSGGCNRENAGPRSVPLIHARGDLDRVTIGDESRFALRGTSYRLPLQVPPGARLEIGFGLSPHAAAADTPSAWPSELEYASFSVVFEDAEQKHTLVERRVGPSAEGESQWHDVTVDLQELAGRHGTLLLEGSASRDDVPGNDFAWTNPRVTVAAAPASKATNLILISIDTLRADHLGCYGYHPPTSPNVDRMAGEGIVFDHVIASSPWTLPSHASMLTGLDPDRHGVVQFGAYRPLPSQLDTLAELLWDRGYETAGLVAGGYVSNYWNFGQGFDRYGQNAGGKRKEPDTLQWAVDRAKPWMQEHQGRPFFLFLHTYQVHLPYTPPPPYDTLFDPDYRGAYEKAFTDRDQYFLELEQPNGVDPRLLHHIAALYDGEIRAMDTAVGDLLDFLRSSGLAQNTCLLFTSDHGEEFGEHGGLSHQHAKLFEELIHVPLIVWCPSRFAGGRRVDALASHTDIVPTTLDLAGAAVPEGLDGRTLLPALQGGQPARRAAAISSVDGSVEKKTGTVTSVRTERYKYIDSKMDGTELLFDLQADPTEKTDLRAQEPDLAHQVRALYDQRERGPAVAAAPVITPDAAMRERLRALGYRD